VYLGSFYFPGIIKPFIMKKFQLLALGSLLLLVFESCKKENMTTNDSKRPAVNQEQSAPAQSAGQPQTTPKTQQPSGCPHAPASQPAG
jgi:hypothetical protein